MSHARWIKSGVSIAFILFALPLHAAPSTWRQQQTANMHEITGPFVQEDYGFSVEAPPRTSGYVTNGGDANHGLLIILGEHRKIVVYPEYTFPDSGSVKPCHRGQFPWEGNSKRTTGTILLGDRKACLETFTSQGGIWSVTQATSDDQGQGIMYTLLLSTTREFFHADLASLRSVAATFKRVPINP